MEPLKKKPFQPGDDIQRSKCCLCVPDSNGESQKKKRQQYCSRWRPAGMEANAFGIPPPPPFPLSIFDLNWQLEVCYDGLSLCVGMSLCIRLMSLRLLSHMHWWWSWTPGGSCACSLLPCENVFATCTPTSNIVLRCVYIHTHVWCVGALDTCATRAFLSCCAGGRGFKCWGVADVI